jgi:nucleoside-diphosphate-sugar epimerase
MKVFITGASGYIGNSIARTFRRAGHEVSGLVRSNEKANLLWGDEIRPVVGDLRKPDSFTQALKDAEVVIHAAAETGPDMPNLDKQAVERILAVAKDGHKTTTVVFTSGVWVYGETKNNRVTEATPTKPLPLVAWRPAHEDMVLKASSDRLLGVVIRPGCVYGGKGSLTGMWFESAEKEGAARIVGDGNNRWAMVHVDDLADAYLKAVHSRVRGEVFNVTDRSRFTIREMAAAASKAAGRNADVKIWPTSEATKQLGPFAEALAIDQHVDSWKAVQVLGWNPRFGGFADDAEVFYNSWKAHR